MRTSIGEKAFGNCTSLTDVTFKPATKTIGSQAFYGCSALKNMYFCCNAPTFGSQCFYGVTATATYINVGDNATWTSSVVSSSCGSGNITWKPDYMYFTSFALTTKSYTYDGTAKKPGFTVKSRDYTHVEGTDYTVTYTNNTNAGTASVTILGKNFYTGSSSKYFTITQASQTLNASISSYTIETGKTATISVPGAKTTGTLTYSSSDTSVATVSTSGVVTAKAVGTATITVNAPADTNYSADSASFSISVKAGVTSGTLTLGTNSYTYNGEEKKPAVTVTVSGKTLIQNTDYVVAYSNNIHAGTATVTVSGTGNYAGTLTKTFTINKAEQNVTATVDATTLKIGGTAKITVTGIGEMIFEAEDGSVATVNQTGKNTATVKALKAGITKVWITVEESENYKGGSATLVFTVNPKQVTGLKASNSTTGVSLTWTKLSGVTGYQVYRKTGSGSYAKVATVTTNKYVDKKASNGSTYTYKVRAYLSSDKTLYGSYSSTAADTWLTRPAISSAKNVATRSILVKWAKNAKAAGYEVQYSTSSAFKSAKTVKITKASTVSKKITSLTKGKTYYVRIRTYKTVSSAKKYSAYSANKKVKIAK